MSEFDIKATPAASTNAVTDAPVRTPSRQVVRRQRIIAKKALSKRNNEAIGRKNARRKGSFGFLNREQYRKFMSNRCPKAFKLDVLKALAA